MAEREGTPSKDDLLKLPRWARVAFAGRCARRVQILFNRWATVQNVDRRHMEAVDNAVALALKSAREGRARAAFAKVAARADSAARLTREGDGDADAAAFAAFAAAAAARAAGNALEEASGSVFITFADAARAADAVAHAVDSAAAFDDAARAACWSDYEKLFELTHEERLTDESRVDPDQLGPLWPNGAPEWATSSRDSSDSVETAMASSLTVSLTLPPMPDDPDARALVTRRVRAIVEELSRVYIEAGGSGLVIKQAELHVEDPAHVPSGGER